MLKFLVLALIPVAFAQGGHRWDATLNKWVPNDAATVNAQPNPNPNPSPVVNVPVVTKNNPHEVGASPNPGPFIHRSLHPVDPVHVARVPIGQVEQRLRRIEVFLGLIDPECRNPYTGPTRQLNRMTYPSDPSKVYHSSEPTHIETAKRAGYVQDQVIGRIATNGIIHKLHRIEYRTKDTYPLRNDFLTGRDFPTFDFQGDLKNWAIEGYCVPYRGACGANLQLSAFTPTRTLGDDRPLTLVTQDSDRVKWGNERGFDETTLCYIWNP